MAVGEAGPEGVLHLGRRAELRAPAHFVAVHAHRRLAHGLSARSHADGSLAQLDLLSHVDARLEAGAAQAVDVERGCRFLHARLEGDVACHVCRVRRGLLDRSYDDRVDQLRRDFGLRDGGLGGGHAQCGGGLPLERTTKGAERRALAGDDEDPGRHIFSNL